MVSRKPVDGWRPLPGEGSPYVPSLGNPSTADTETLHAETTKRDPRGARKS